MYAVVLVLEIWKASRKVSQKIKTEKRIRLRSIKKHRIVLYAAV